MHAVGGVQGHIHLLLSLRPADRVADVARCLKGASSHYINHESGLDAMLYWQDGYGVITLRQAEILKIVQYILNQQRHHDEQRLSEVLETSY